MGTGISASSPLSAYKLGGFLRLVLAKAAMQMRPPI
jgi:hypothetical protein